MSSQGEHAVEAIRSASGILYVGIGGGGDVAGALVVSRTVATLAPQTGARLGGISWERRTIDPLAGPRAICELSDSSVLDPCAALAGPGTSGPDGLTLSEARASAFLGGEMVALIDPGEGAAMAAAGIVAAANSLHCDLVVLVDVGGDALAHGHEANLVSPLGDAIILATTPWIEQAGLVVIAAVLGLGCDGELSREDCEARLAEVDAAGGEHHCLSIPRAEAPMLETAARFMASEATLMTIRCALGERGQVPIRAGLRVANLTAAGAQVHLFSARVAFGSVARLAKAVVHTSSIEEAHERLLELGVQTTGLGYPGTTWEPPRERKVARERRHACINSR